MKEVAMNPFKSRLGIAAVISALALAGIILTAYIIGNNEPIGAAKLEVEKNDKMYCAELVTYELGKNEVEITITNCGDPEISIKNKQIDSKDGVLASGEEYRAVLSRDNGFYAMIETTDGEGLGSLGFFP